MEVTPNTSVAEAPEDVVTKVTKDAEAEEVALPVVSEEAIEEESTNPSEVAGASRAFERFGFRFTHPK